MNTTKWIAGGALLGIAVVVIVMAEGSVDAQRPDRPQIDSATAAADNSNMSRLFFRGRSAPAADHGAAGIADTGAAAALDGPRHARAQLQDELAGRELLIA